MPAPHIESLTDAQVSLLGSIEADELEVDFQAVVDLKTGATYGHEAALRSRDESLSDPHELYARAAFERTVGELGRVLRSRALSAVAQTPARHLFVRVHPGELKDGLLVRPDDPLFLHDAAVCLQVCQPGFSAVASQLLSELRGRSDVSLVIDDFGAGPCTLKHVIELEPSGLKLDRELIGSLDKDPRKRIAVRHVARLCEDLGATLIAKGIETRGELAAAVDCGVTLGQGTLLGESFETPRAAAWPPVSSRRP
jgi:EAL domain-containing protein (putative c-di-GMP-specific phosphodiesterase class I)